MFISNEELVKQLQGVLRADPSEGHGGSDDERVRRVRSLAAELAARIHRDSDQWGLTNVPKEFRDDAAKDTFTALLFAIPGMRGRQNIAEWFGTTLESKFRRLWSLDERQKIERERLAVAAAANPRPETLEQVDSELLSVPSLFEDSVGPWASFETTFPRDAFALRLRYLLERDLEEMAVMLDAPTSRAISMRLDRARDRFRMYCEQVGIGRKDVAVMMEQLAEEPIS